MPRRYTNKITMEKLLSKLRDRLTYSPAVELDAMCVRGNEAGEILPPRRPNSPISQGELQAVEASLGFSLPTIVRRISTEIADGGFGPEWGINRLKHPPGLPFGPHWMVEMSAESWHTLYHEDAGQRVLAYPERFIRYCESGCNISVCVDCTTDMARMFVDDPNVDSPIQYNGLTVQEWLENWLARPWPTDKYA